MVANNTITVAVDVRSIPMRTNSSEMMAVAKTSNMPSTQR